MTIKSFTIFSFLLALAIGTTTAAENPAIPTDAPQDAVMAAGAEVQAAADWLSAAMLGKQSDTAQKYFLDTVVPFSFRLGGADSKTFLKSWKQESSTKDTADRVVHQISWTDPATGLRVTAEATTFKRYPAVDWVLYFENQGQKDTPILEDIRALDAIVKTADAKQPAVLHRLNGDNCNEQSFLPTETPLSAGQNIGMAPCGGRPSNATAFPFFNFEFAGQGLLTAIGWSGQWSAQLDRTAEGPTRLRAGMEKTHLLLHPGEKIRSPRILLMPWQGSRQAAHQRFRRLLMFSYAPRPTGVRPLQLPFASQCFDRYNSRPGWATEAGQIAAAKLSAQYGADHFWFDAGWFPGNFPNGVGNWFCKPQEFPHGLKPVSDVCHQEGMKYIVWFEPERVAKDTQIAREHPEFVLGGKEGGLYNLGNPAARRWLTDLLSQRITEFGMDVYRNDFNIDPLDFWRRNDTPDRQGISEIRYVEGHYAMWDELIAKHPGLWIDNCASGGRRIDLESIRRSVPLWRSDTSCWGGHPEWDQRQSQGLSLYIPLFTACDWATDAYTTRSTAAGGMICQFDYLNEQFSVEQAKRALAEVKENQQFWYGDYYPLTNVSLGNDVWAAWQLHRADLDAGIALAFRRGDSPYPAITVKLGGIDAAKDYAVEFIDESYQKVNKTIPGRELATELELRLPKKQSSLLVRYKPVAQK